MKKLLALAALLAVTACSTIQTLTTPVSTVDAQKALVTLQLAHAAALTSELVYLNQPACGLAGSRPPPFCASLKVGKQMKAADVAFTGTMTAAQSAVADLGESASVIDAAIKAAQASLSAFQAITAAYAPMPAKGG